VQKNFKLSLGPFQGITDVYYRQLFEAHFGGIDKYYTPFFTGIYKVSGRSLRAHEIDPAWNNTAKLCPQILSRDAHEIILFGKACKDLGYNEINWNMGCPYPRVAKKKRGSGLLPYPDLVENLLADIKKELPLSLSIKCRLGYEDPHELDALIPFFNAYGLSELIVHARIGKQLYQGGVNEDRFAQIAGAITTELVYNGDVFSKAGFERFQNHFPGVGHWMLGRGLLADPFLALDLKNECDDGFDERKEKVLRFMTDLFLQRRKVSGDRLTSLGRMKELWSYLVWSFSEPQSAWRLIRKCNSFETYEQAVAQVFEQLDWVGVGYSKNETL
jgi:tRNA-dihydrouridine synthase B